MDKKLRKVFKEKTIQEQRNEQDMDSPKYRHSNGDVNEL